MNEMSIHAGKCEFCNEEKRYVYRSNGHAICGKCGRCAAYGETRDFLGDPSKGVTISITKEDILSSLLGTKI